MIHTFRNTQRPIDKSHTLNLCLIYCMSSVYCLVQRISQKKGKKRNWEIFENGDIHFLLWVYFHYYRKKSLDKFKKTTLHKETKKQKGGVGPSTWGIKSGQRRRVLHGKKNTQEREKKVLLKMSLKLKQMQSVTIYYTIKQGTCRQCPCGPPGMWSVSCSTSPGSKSRYSSSCKSTPVFTLSGIQIISLLVNKQPNVQSQSAVSAALLFGPAGILWDMLGNNHEKQVGSTKAGGIMNLNAPE